MSKTGIYKIENLVNGKIYIGYTNNLANRITQHYSKLRANKHPNEHLQSAWNKYGEESFIFRVLELCNSDIVIEREHYWTNKLNTHNPEFGYNIKPTGITNYKRHSFETRNKIKQKRLVQVIPREAYKDAQKNKRKKVYQYDLQGNLIQEWNSLADVAKKLSLSTGTLSNACLKKNRTKTYKNFIWSYNKNQNKNATSTIPSNNNIRADYNSFSNIRA